MQFANFTMASDTWTANSNFSHCGLCIHEGINEHDYITSFMLIRFILFIFRCIYVDDKDHANSWIYFFENIL